MTDHLAIPTALEVEMARAARWIEAQPRSEYIGFDLQRGARSCRAHLYIPGAGDVRHLVRGGGDLPEDALCELLDKVEGRG